ncbi:MAG: glycosyltransferase [Spirochaetia bacterium]|nr:glycosyltransferase [Spirochaetia bacterium]
MEYFASLQQLFSWSAIVYWIAGFLLLWRIPPVNRGGRGAEDVSIVIPARNEAGNIGVLLESIVGQWSRPGEVIVVDDQSTDATAEIARGYAAAGVRVVAAEQRPEGWTGKNWSCRCGVVQARGRRILFLDADTRLEAPDALEQLASEQLERGGMLSVQPYHRVHKLYEQLSGFFNLIVMVGSGAFDFWSKPGLADGCFGPCILTDRRDYEAVGGHGAVRGQVVDDLALCGLYRRRGLGVHCFGGRGVISFRMYPGGPASLVEGWTKNMAMGASLSKLRSILLLVIWFTGISNVSLAVWALAVGGASTALGALSTAGTWWSAVLVVAVYGLYTAQVWVQLRRVGSFSLLSALLFPLEFLFFVGVFVYSIIRTRLFGSVSWKGRSIKIERAKKKVKKRKAQK